MVNMQHLTTLTADIIQNVKQLTDPNTKQIWAWLLLVLVLSQTVSSDNSNTVTTSKLLTNLDKQHFPRQDQIKY